MDRLYLLKNLKANDGLHKLPLNRQKLISYVAIELTFALGQFGSFI